MRQQPGLVHASVTVTEQPRPLTFEGSSAAGASGKASDNGSQRSVRGSRSRGYKVQRQREESGKRSSREAGSSTRNDKLNPLSQHSTSTSGPVLPLITRARSADASRPSVSPKNGSISLPPISQQPSDLADNVVELAIGTVGNAAKSGRLPQPTCRSLEEPPSPAGARSAGLIQLPMGTQVQSDEQGSSRSAKHRQSRDKSVASQGPTNKGSRSGSGRGGGPPSRHDRFDNASQIRTAATDGSQHQLFDPKRHNAVQFSKSVATFSTSDARSSAAGSIATTATTSTTSTTSGDSRDRRQIRDSATSHKSKEIISDTSSHVNELKRIYRDINNLETKLKEDHVDAAEKSSGGLSHVDTANPISALRLDGSVNHEFWLMLRAQVQELISLYQVFLDRAMKPGLPPSLSSLPHDYDIPIRLWKNGVHLYLERIRHQLPHPGGCDSKRVTDPSQAAVQTDTLDLLVDFIQFAYSFYTNLLEAEHLRPFRTIWLENLGDLARWRMAAAGINTTSARAPGDRDDEITKVRVNDHGSASLAKGEAEAVPSLLLLEGAPTAKDADHPDRASIGKAALGDWDFDERETWRTTAIDWYTQGLIEMPGQGKLHHSIGLLHREDELRCFYHFCKSLTVSDPHAAARQTVSVLSLFSAEQQERRTRSDASWLDLLLCLHGMLFHQVQLDQFEEKCSRAMATLKLTLSSSNADVIDSPTWMMVAGINIAALMQYGAEDGLLLVSSSAAGQAIPSAKTKHDVRDDHIRSGTGASGASVGTAASAVRSRDSSQGKVFSDDNISGQKRHPPLTLQHAATLAFGLLELVLTCQTRNLGSRGPYVTMIFTFLFRLAKESSSDTQSPLPAQLRLLAPFLPWHSFAALNLPAGVALGSNSLRHYKISSGMPLPEDWCLRGLGWAGRKVFERDFWKSSGSKLGTSKSESHHLTSEFDVLEQDVEGGHHVEDSPRDASPNGSSVEDCEGLLSSRWTRVTLSLGALAQTISGLAVTVHEGRAKVEIRPPLCDAIQRWIRHETDDVVDAAIVDGTTTSGGASPIGDDLLSQAEGDAEDVDDWNESDYTAEETVSAEVKDLKARRLRLLQALAAAQPGHSDSDSSRTQERHKMAAAVRVFDRDGVSSLHSSPACKAVPGYTILVLDTNILLAKESYLPDLVECKRWTIVIPLAVITELDGLKRNPPPLGEEAAKVLAYLDRSLKTFSKWLKIQTSKGSYLTDLSFRSEEIDFSGAYSGGNERRVVKGQGGSSSQHGSPNPSAGTFATPMPLHSSLPASSPGPPQQNEMSLIVPLARSLDDVILRTYQWHSQHFVDRLALLSSSTEEASKIRSDKIKSDTPTIVLVTLDRGMRLRVRAAGGVAAGREELLEILRMVGRGEGRARA